MVGRSYRSRRGWAMTDSGSGAGGLPWTPGGPGWGPPPASPPSGYGPQPGYGPPPGYPPPPGHGPPPGYGPSRGYGAPQGGPGWTPSWEPPSPFASWGQRLGATLLVLLPIFGVVVVFGGIAGVLV